METIIFIAILVIILFNFLFERLLDYLNLRNARTDLPVEAEGIYDAGRYKKSQEYFKTNLAFSIIASTIQLIALLLVLFLGGFSLVDKFARTFTQNPVLLALIFFGVTALIIDLFGTIFSLYHTFEIEERFGFNKTTLKTFFLDKVKGYVLTAIIGGGLLALVVWIYEWSGGYFWLLAWAVMSLFTILATMFFASLILPLFNKLTPLGEGDLRTAIESYCQKVGFKLDNLFVMDGSKRSSKANAFFSGLGTRKKIVLFDTLVEKHTTEELVGVLAHEVGHYKKKHTLMGVALGILETGLMLFILSLFLNNPVLSGALGAKEASFHMGLLAFMLLYSPLSLLLSILTNIISRRNEYEADRYAAETFAAQPLQVALKKLSVDTLSNLTPHPAYVFVHYSHPPVLDRLKALEKLQTK